MMQKLKKFFSFFKTEEQNKGFTLLELLIVIAILATLATIVVLVLNPAETLAKSRDTQRMSDLATLKSAIALYTTTVSSPTLGSTTDTGTNPRTNFSNTACKNAGTWTVGEDRIWYSLPTDGTGGVEITDSTLDGATFSAGYGATQVTVVESTSYLTLADGTGWIPVKLTDVVGGTPLSSLPIDPTNALSVAGHSSAVDNTDLIYRYACYSSGSILSFEIDAVLESEEFKTNAKKMSKDGGNDSDYYEVGTKLDIMGAGTNDF